MALVDYFLKLDGIQGESNDSKHKNEIEIESFSWGANQTGTASHGGGMGAGRVQMQDFNFVMRVNKSSPKLMLSCANGEHIKNAILTCRKAGKEQISLNFTKVEMEYKEQKPDGGLGGAIKAFYDMKQQISG